MAKRFVRCTLVLSLLSVLWAPAVKAQDWQFGVHIDPAVNWFFSDFPYVTNAGGQFGFRSGIEANWNIIERVGLLFGLSYDLRMANLLYSDTALFVEAKYSGPVLMTKGSVLKTSAQYLYFPIGVKMKAVQIGYWTITSAVGFSCNVLLSQRIESKERGLRKSLSQNFFTWGFPGYFLRLGTEYSLGGRSALDAGIAYHGTFSAVAKPGVGRLYYHNLTFRIGFLF